MEINEKRNCFATGETPGNVVFLIDNTASMEKMIEGKKCIDIANEIITSFITKMMMRCIVSSSIFDRYRVGIFLYSDELLSILPNGVEPISEFARMEVPVFSTDYISDSNKVFNSFSSIVEKVMAKLPEGSPTLTIINVTDSGFEFPNDNCDFRKIIDRDDIHVCNIVIDDIVLKNVGGDKWTGFSLLDTFESPKFTEFVKFSSSVSQEVLQRAEGNGYHFREHMRLFFPHSYSEVAENCLLPLVRPT